MSTKSDLLGRADHKCELCSANQELDVFEIPPHFDGSAAQCVLICSKCHDQLAPSATLDTHHWHCLNEAIWSTEPAVQVMAWRLLNQLSPKEAWARQLLDTAYLDDETLNWATSASDDPETREAIIHLDANGAVLQAGDTVTLIKDLNVKGAGFTAKRGTSVRGISLVSDNADQIEGRVSGQQIILLTQFVKKSG